MNVCFLGSKDLTPDEAMRARDLITAFITDNCTGVEPKYQNVYISNGSGVPSITAEVVHSLRVNYEIIPTKVYKWDAPGGFRDTNTEIIDSSDYVVILCTNDVNSGGVSWCERYVRRASKPFKVVWVSKAEEGYSPPEEKITEE